MISVVFVLNYVVLSQNSPINDLGQPIFQDVSFTQEYAVKYYFSGPFGQLEKCYSDRNGNTRVSYSGGMLQPTGGEFLRPGDLWPDRQYLPMKDQEIRDFESYQQQFVYLDSESVFSNAWAGKYRLLHSLPSAQVLCMGTDFSCLITDGVTLQYLKDGQEPFSIKLLSKVSLIKYSESRGQFYLLADDGIYSYDGNAGKNVRKILNGSYAAFEVSNNEMTLATIDGILKYNLNSGQIVGDKNDRFPSLLITTLAYIDGKLWLGSEDGLFMQKEDGTFNFYNGERWLTDNHIMHISSGPQHSINVLTKTGLSQIVFKDLNLYDKAVFYEQQVRSRHIRHGFNAHLGDMQKGRLETGTLKDSDNDGLWTSMYLAGQAFRYAVTKSDDALQNCVESLDALERLFTINPVPGFPSRSFERHGYKPLLADPDRWQHAPDRHWDWKATTSSDEAIGHIFAFGVIAELIEDSNLKEQAVKLIDTLMSHIVINDLYMIDFDGKHTTWGRWNPDYVNSLPEIVGDRKLNSSNIIAMLQTAYHFTKKEKYKKKALELLNQHGYLKNLMRPMDQVGNAPEDADDWSKMLSESWNHSDDEMYFVGYWGLYRYALTDELRNQYREAIIDHWQAERPEKEGLWNIFTAITGTSEFDLQNAIWYLQEYPLDLIDWNIVNSKRKDIDFIADNFREQSLLRVLPPDEAPVQRHNSNMFNLDRIGGNGLSEYSAGDIWLLPYWMGRYLGIISGPLENETAIH
ncbi:MAG: hypothetical protein IPL46_18710 [Saprospiraceae bacterium]|nr:hypothetical protein [Saprospiraceae bacterium]